MNSQNNGLQLCTVYLNNKMYKDCEIKNIEPGTKSIQFYSHYEHKEYYAIADFILIEKQAD